MADTLTSEPSAPPRLTIMQSTLVPTADGGTARIVHEPGTPVPEVAPRCSSSCWCRS